MQLYYDDNALCAYVHSDVYGELLYNLGFYISSYMVSHDGIFLFVSVCFFVCVHFRVKNCV